MFSSEKKQNDSAIQRFMNFHNMFGRYDTQRTYGRTDSQKDAQKSHVLC